MSFFVAIQDPIIQKFAARFAAGYLSEKIGTDVRVGRMVVTLDFRVFLNDVSVKDLNDNDIVRIGSARTKIAMRDLMDGILHLESLDLRDTDASIVQYKGDGKFNFAFIAEAFKSETVSNPGKAPMTIMVDRLSLKNVDFVYWNQNKDNPEKSKQHIMDYAHIDVDDINMEATHFYMHGDSVYAIVNKLNAKELCGFELKQFRSNATVCQNGIYLDNMKMETNNSLFDADIRMNYSGYKAFGDFVDSVVFDATFRPTEVMLSDIGAFAGVMYQMPNRVQFEGGFSGPISHFSVNDFVAQYGRSTIIKGNMSMHPLDFDDGEHTMKLDEVRFTYDDLVCFHIPGRLSTIPLPESLRPINQGVAMVDFEGSYNSFVSEVSLVSDVGDIDVAVTRSKNADGSNLFFGSINAERVKVGAISNASKYVGDLDINANYRVLFPRNGSPELNVDGIAYQAEILGSHIDEIKLDGDLKENRFKGKINIDADDLCLDFNGLVDFNDKKKPKADFFACINHANLNALRLINYDSESTVSTKIYVNLNGFDLDGLEGEVRIDSTVYRDSRGTYRMDEFTASVVDDNIMQRRISMDCDFFNFKMAGKINFASLVPVLNEHVDSFVHFPHWKEDLEAFQEYKLSNDIEQDFVVSLSLKDTRTLSRLLMPSLKIAKNTTINGTFTSKARQLNLTARSKYFQIGDMHVNNVELRNFNTRNAAYGILTIGEVLYSHVSATDTMDFGLDNIILSSKMSNDTISARIVWDDIAELDHNKASIEASFHPHEKGGAINISKADLVVNDSLWNITPNSRIDISNGRVSISNLAFLHHNQALRIDGYVPMKESDTLSVQLQQFDVSNFDALFEHFGFDVDGHINGEALLGNMKVSSMVLAEISIDGLGVNGQTIGDAFVESSWNNLDRSFDLNLNIMDDGRKTFNAFGSYYTAKKADNLDFTIALDSLQLSAFSPFLTGIVSRLQGYGNGQATVKGTIDQPKINAQITLKEGGCKVGYLNTFYTFNPTIHIDNKVIKLENMVLTDTLGNKARVDGEIRHNNLKDFYLDLRLLPRNFLAMATTSKDNDSFYGSAVANGLVTVKGPFKDIALDIKANTQRGTNITIPLNQSAKVKDNDFIVFVSKGGEDEQEEVKKNENSRSDFAMNLDVAATDEADLRIILPGNIGIIDATGNGNVKIGTSNKTPLTMFGEYGIKSGRFQLTLMNLVTKMFNLRQGGTISWSGEPTDGRIDATGVYSLKAPLTGLGLQVDSTSVNSHVNVECLIHLKGALLNPDITFGMNLPNASEDVAQTVFALVDTTNQAVMQLQAVSLLVLGSFAYAGGSGNANPTLNLSNLLSGGMQLDITDNLNLVLRYLSGNDDSYKEYQLALRTELFENRLTIETNLGVMSNNNSSNASKIIGEYDMYYKLTKDGKLQGHFYNHSNYNSNFNSFTFDRRAPYTQGLGLSYSKSFDSFRNIFKKKSLVQGQPLISPKRKENN